MAVVGTALFYKPDDYFEAGGGWRRKPGGGPILLNLTHEVNNLHVAGRRHRPGAGGDVERDARIPGRGHRRDGVHRSRTARSAPSCCPTPRRRPRSWEQTSQENKSYPTYADEDCYHIAGTTGSLSIPTHAAQGLRRRSGPGGSRSTSPAEPVERTDPLANQIAHFAAVIRGEAEPICSGRDGLKTLQVVDAVLKAARTGAPVDTHI